MIKKLGDGAVPFRLTVPAGAPGSVTLQPGLEDEGEPCGVHYYVKIFVGDSEIDRSHRRYLVVSVQWLRKVYVYLSCGSTLFKRAQ